MKMETAKLQIIWKLNILFLNLLDLIKNRSNKFQNYLALSVGWKTVNGNKQNRFWYFLVFFAQWWISTISISFWVYLVQIWTSTLFFVTEWSSVTFLIPLHANDVRVLLKDWLELWGVPRLGSKWFLTLNLQKFLSKRVNLQKFLAQPQPVSSLPHWYGTLTMVHEAIWDA